MVSGDLARVLAAGRTTINARIEAARHRSPRFDVEAFRRFVASDLDAVAMALARSHPERVAEAVHAALMFGIESLELGLIGPQARTPWVADVWSRVAPRLGRVLAVTPRQALAALTNAAARLGDTRGVRTAQWIELMQAIAPTLSSLEQLHSAGALCAWRAGMAPLRVSALAAADSLAPSTALSCLQMSPGCDWPALRERLRRTRWPSLEADQSAAAWVLGGFTGLGGPFSRPPTVSAGSSGFVVVSDERRFQIEADVFGATVVPAGGAVAAPPAGTPSQATVRAASGLAERLGLPETELALCEGAESLAAVSPWSHRLVVAPRPS